MSNLVDYVRETKNGQEYLYNVVYTGKKPKNKKALKQSEDE